MSDVSRRDFLMKSGVLAGAGAMATGLYAGEDSAEELKKIGRTPHTKFAVNIEMWWTKLPFIERIRQAAALGFPAVEFWPLDGKNLEEVASVSRDLGIEIAQFTAWGFKPGLNEPKNHAAFVEAIKKAIQAAKVLNCRKATIVAGDDVPGVSQEQMHAEVIKGIKQVTGLVEDAGLMLILEPMNIRVDHKGHCLYGSEPAMKICDAVGSPMVKLNWDLYHMHITEGDLCGHLREGMQRGHIGYLQLADHPGRNEPGTGEIHYNRVLKEAYNLGYRDYVGLECRPLEGEITAAKRVAAADVW